MIGKCKIYGAKISNFILISKVFVKKVKKYCVFQVKL